MSGLSGPTSRVTIRFGSRSVTTEPLTILRARIVTVREHSWMFAASRSIIFPYGNAEGIMNITAQDIGRLVRTTRKKLGVTQRDLALTSGTGLRFVIDLERGKPTCEIGKSLMVVQTLGIRITLAAPTAAKEA